MQERQEPTRTSCQIPGSHSPAVPHVLHVHLPGSCELAGRSWELAGRSQDRGVRQRFSRSEGISWRRPLIPPGTPARRPPPLAATPTHLSRFACAREHQGASRRPAPHPDDAHPLTPFDLSHGKHARTRPQLPSRPHVCHPHHPLAAPRSPLSPALGSPPVQHPGGPTVAPQAPRGRGCAGHPARRARSTTSDLRATPQHSTRARQKTVFTAGQHPRISRTNPVGEFGPWCGTGGPPGGEALGRRATPICTWRA